MNNPPSLMTTQLSVSLSQLDQEVFDHSFKIFKTIERFLKERLKEFLKIH